MCTALFCIIPLSVSAEVVFVPSAYLITLKLGFVEECCSKGATAVSSLMSVFSLSQRC